MLKRYPSVLLALILLAGCSAATAGRIIVGGARVIAGVPVSAPTAEPTTPPPAPTPRQPQCDDISGPKCDCWRWAVPADVWDACVRETPTPTPTLEPTAEPTVSAQHPPVLKGINGGGGCKDQTERFDGDFVTCELDFTQLFHGSDGQDGPCDSDHFCKPKPVDYDALNRLCVPATEVAMGDECGFRDWDETRTINQGGFIVVPDGADLVPGSATSHQVKIRGRRGARVSIRKCPPDDLRSREGIPIDVRGEHPFDRNGCGVKAWELPRTRPTQKPTKRPR